MTREAASQRPDRTPTWRPVRLVVQLLLLCALLVVAFFFFDLEQVRVALNQVSLPNLLGFLTLMLAARAVAAWRWKIVARDHAGLPEVSALFLLRVELLAGFADLWLQSFIGGEAVRMWKVGQRTGKGKQAVASVALDRVVGTVGLLAACLPLLITLGAAAPELRISGQSWLLVGLTALLLALATVVVFRTIPVARMFLRRSLDFLRDQRFPLVPLLISLLIYPLIVLAHKTGFPTLGGGSWLVVAMVALLPRLGRIVPLSLFGITAVEGSIFVVGSLLEVPTETLVLVVALNLLAKYVASGLGAVAELVADGRRFFREVRWSAGDRGGAMVAEGMEKGPEG